MALHACQSQRRYLGCAALPPFSRLATHWRGLGDGDDGTDAHFLLPYLGVLLVGLGDSFASLAGMYLGRIKWPHTKKTVEGTMAAVAVVLLAGLLLSLCYPFVSLSLGQVRTTTPLHPFLLAEEFVAHMSLPRLTSLVVVGELAVARLRVGGGVWLPVGGLHHADRQPGASALRLRRAVLLTRRVSTSQRQKRSTHPLG